MASPYFNRSDMAAEFYDRHLFGGKTFGDLLKRNRRPFLSLNATDMSLGATFQFTQEQFDYLCSDISTFPVARAVPASAALPILLSPITVNNYAGSCGCVEPAWKVSALTDRQKRTRRTVKAMELQSYQNSAQHPYLHLLDGGLTDNLGLRGPFEAIAVKGGIRNSIQDDLNPNLVSKLVIIVVKLKIWLRQDFGLSSNTQGDYAGINSLGSVALRRLTSSNNLSYVLRGPGSSARARQARKSSRSSTSLSLSLMRRLRRRFMILPMLLIWQPTNSSVSKDKYTVKSSSTRSA